MIKLVDIRRLIIVSLILILVIGFTGCAKDIEGIVATVNDEDITQEEFDTEFQIYRESYERQLGKEALTEVGSDGRTLENAIKQNVLDTLIVERLILKDSENNNITVTDDEVNERVDEIIESLGGETEFEEFLESNAMSKEYFIKFTKNDLIFTKHMDNYLSNTDISEEEAKEYFNKNKEDLIIVRASHILLSTEEDGKRVLEAINKGENFEDLAVEESKDSQSAVNGGDLGYIIKGQYTAVQEFEKAVFDLEVGEISDLVKTEVGYHIIRLDERKDTFEDLKQGIIDLLKEQGYTEYIENLRDKGKIKVYMDIQ
ncbi:MAG: peptidylprolyl isomerase [Tissierellaceae bacterium]|nr:peptidylprolyl isomerase [Tissierellaceae bacterium]